MSDRAKVAHLTALATLLGGIGPGMLRPRAVGQCPSLRPKAETPPHIVARLLAKAESKRQLRRRRNIRNWRKEGVIE